MTEKTIWKAAVVALLLFQCVSAQIDNSSQTKENITWEQQFAGSPITGGATTSASLSRGSLTAGLAVLALIALAIIGFKMHRTIKWLGSPARKIEVKA
jgi:phosphatidylserine synthase